MSPYAKAVQSIIRMVAFGLVVLSACLYSSDVFLYMSRRGALSGTGALALKGLPFLAGVVLFWKSSAMAGRFTKDLE